MGGPIGWNEVAPGVWARAFGEPEAFTPRSAVGRPPRLEALRALPPGGFPFPPSAVTGEVAGGRTVVRLPLAPGQPVFGLGLQFQRLDHRGRTRYLRVNSDPIQDTGETHAPVPFYVAGDGYAVLLDTARIVTLHVASVVRREEPVDTRDRTTDAGWQVTPAGSWVEAVLQGPGVEVLVFAGPTPLDAVRRYNLFSGGGCLPPRWGLGFWHRTPSKHSAAQVEAEAAEYRRHGVPCDVIGLEPGWQSAAYPCSYEWSPERFPEPAAFLGRMAEAGFTVNLWEHAWVSAKAPIHQPLAPLSGTHTVWGGLAPDYTLPEARAILEAQHDHAHVDLGVSGYKLDECDGSELTAGSWMFPAQAAFPSGRDGEQMRQVYGLLLQSMTAGLFWRRDRRTFGLVRASGAGAAPFPYALYTDLYNHRQYVRALCNAGFAGMLFAAEVRSAQSPEDWIRRLQVACMSPLAQLDAWSSGTKPWTFPEMEGAVRQAVELRMRLLPYLYTAFARYYFDGTPPFRAMALDPEPGPARLADDQYLIGPDLLVAPLFAGERERAVRLPAGDWYDFETGARWAGGTTITLQAGPESIPLLVRDGGIIPLMPALQRAPRPGDTVPLEVRHYGHRPGSFRLYDDDGETLAFARGACRWIELSCVVAADGSRSGRVEAGPPAGWLVYDPVRWVFLG